MNGNGKVRAAFLHAQVCVEIGSVWAKTLHWNGQLVTFRLMVHGKCTLPRIVGAFKFERAAFKSNDEDRRFANRETAYLTEMIRRVDKRYPEHIKRLFGRAKQAGWTYFPIKKLRTDENTFMCHYRAQRWLEHLMKRVPAFQLFKIQDKEAFQVFVRVCVCSFKCLQLRRNTQGRAKGGSGPPRRDAFFAKIKTIHQIDEDADLEQDYFFIREFGPPPTAEEEKDENGDIEMAEVEQEKPEMIHVRGYYWVPRRKPSERIRKLAEKAKNESEPGVVDGMRKRRKLN